MERREFQTNNADSVKKTEFFHNLALKHLPEMRLLIKGGGLSKKEGWRNVVEHCLVQIAVSETLSRLLGLSEEDSQKLIRVAACHDWAKRLERKPDGFTEEEKGEAMTLLAKLAPNQGLMKATGPEFLEKALIRGESTFLERLQFYIDDITKGSEIVPFDERVNEVEARRQDLNDDLVLTAKLGGRYWDRERELGHQTEQEIFDRLQETGVKIDSPKDIPVFVVQTIESEMKS